MKPIRELVRTHLPVSSNTPKNGQCWTLIWFKWVLIFKEAALGLENLTVYAASFIGPFQEPFICCFFTLLDLSIIGIFKLKIYRKQTNLCAMDFCREDGAERKDEAFFY